MPWPPRSPDEIRKVVAEAIHPAHFFFQRPLILEWHHLPCEQTAWEIYQGRLLDPAHTRLRQTFESWTVFCIESGSRSAEPLLSVKLDVAGRQLHVTRAIYCYAWEGYHAGDNVYLSRETRKWVRELVGSIPLDRFQDDGQLRAELATLLFQAVVGSSRLPLQSVEAPLPAFSLGNLAYFYRSGGGPLHGPPMQSFQDLIEEGLQDDLTWLEKAKLLEAVLRGTTRENLVQAGELFMHRWLDLGYTNNDWIRLCRTLFNEIALSPYTDFVDKWLFFLSSLEQRGYLDADRHIDFLSYMLRQNVRHLTAYDLITFHHCGANYPDALLLNAVLKAYLAQIEGRPACFLCTGSDGAACRRQKQLRRRALRQAWLLRRMVEGLPIPDAPTSPGENSRVLPPPFERVPEEQIFQPDKRTKRLFEGEPLLFPGERSRLALQQSIADLRHPAELQELGMAIFLARPLGIGKAATEPDRTLLLSYETFSRSIAMHRLRFLALQPDCNWDEEAFEKYRQALLRDMRVEGIPLPRSPRDRRPGAVVLQDAASVADDFLVLRTTRQAVDAFVQQFDFAALSKRIALDYLEPHRRLLIASAVSTRSGPEGILDIYDGRLQRRLELQVDLSQGYDCRAGQEYPAAGLRVLRAWDAASSAGKAQEHDLETESIILPPRG
jgi:hypothetical protein